MKLVLALLIFSCSAQQLTPIPSPIDGFYLGPVFSNYTLEVFYDHLCPDSKAAFPGLYQYWQANQAWLGLNIHILPLSWHEFSFVAAQAGRYIQLTYPSKFINFLTYFFQYQNLIINNYPSWDFPTVQLKIAGLTNQATGISTNEILNALNDDDINESTRVSWKYGISRLISGAPLYLINDIWVPGVTGFTTSAQWSDFFSTINN